MCKIAVSELAFHCSEIYYLVKEIQPLNKYLIILYCVYSIHAFKRSASVSGFTPR